MNTLTLILVAVVVWLSYVMYDSYTAMQKELREIRLRCMGTVDSKYATPSVSNTMKQGLIETLTALAKVSQ